MSKAKAQMLLGIYKISEFCETWSHNKIKDKFKLICEIKGNSITIYKEGPPLLKTGSWLKIPGLRPQDRDNFMRI